MFRHKRGIFSDESDEKDSDDGFPSKRRKKSGGLFDSTFADESDEEEDWKKTILVGKSKKKPAFINTDSDEDDEPKVKRRCGIIDTDEDESEDASDESSSSEEEEEEEVHKDKGEEDENLCPICLGSFEDQMIGIPENCKHIFCVDCLTEWSKNVNNCPVDRKKFNSITIKDKYGEVIDKVVIEDVKRNDDDIYEDPPTYCQVCRECDREDCMLLCDECDDGYHMDCLSPPLDCVPIDEWFCVECAPPPKEIRRRNSRRTSGGSESEFIGDEGALNNLHDRVGACVAKREHLMFGQTSSSKKKQARTVASNRSNPRRRGSSSVSLRSSGRGKKRKSSKGKKSSKKKGKRKKSKGKAKKKVIDDQLEKVREKLKQDFDVCRPDGVSLYGDHLSLDTFFESEYEEEEQVAPVRSTLVNTPDVVGSILGEFERLDPQKVVVARDGTLKEKSKLPTDTKSHPNKTAPVKKRKIRFTVNDGDDDDDNDDDQSKKDEVGKENLTHSDAQGTERADKAYPIEKHPEMENKEHRNALVDIMRERLQATLEKKAKDVKFKQECKLIKSSNDKLEFKTNSSIVSVASFKIPKLKKKESAENVTEEKECMENTANGLCNASNLVDSTCESKLDENSCVFSKKENSTHQRNKSFIKETRREEKETTKKSHEDLCVKTKKPLEFFKDTEQHLRNPEKRRPPLTTLERKVKLYNEGKGKLMRSSSKGHKSKPIKLPNKDILRNVTPSMQKVRRENSYSPLKSSRNYESNLSTSSNPNSLNDAKNSGDLRKKSISISDYRNRRLLEEVFGDAEIREKKDETELSPPLCQLDARKPNRISLIDPRLYNPAKGKKSEVSSSSTITITQPCFSNRRMATYSNTSSSTSIKNDNAVATDVFSSCQQISTSIDANITISTSPKYRSLAGSSSYSPISTSISKSSPCHPISRNDANLNIYDGSQYRSPKSSSCKPIMTNISKSSSCRLTSTSAATSMNTHTSTRYKSPVASSSYSPIEASICKSSSCQLIFTNSATYMNTFSSTKYRSPASSSSCSPIATSIYEPISASNAATIDSANSTIYRGPPSSLMHNPMETSIYKSVSCQSISTCSITNVNTTTNTKLRSPAASSLYSPITTNICRKKLFKSNDSDKDGSGKFNENSPYSVFRPFHQGSTCSTPIAVVSPSPRDLTSKVSLDINNTTISSTIALAGASASYQVSSLSDPLKQKLTRSTSSIIHSGTVAKLSLLEKQGISLFSTQYKTHNSQRKISLNVKDHHMKCNPPLKAEKKESTHNADYIPKIKDILKPYYKRGMVTKEDWKTVVKMTVKMIQANPAYFSSDESITILVKKQLKPFLLTNLNI